MTEKLGPNQEAIVAPLEARCKHLEDFYHIPPPLAAAIVAHAEMTHIHIGDCYRMDDRSGMKVNAVGFLSIWSNVGAAMDMVGQPLGLGAKRLYEAAQYALQRTIKENAELGARLMHDDAFAKTYANHIAGAEMEAFIKKMTK